MQALQPLLVGAALLRGRAALPPFDTAYAEQVEQRAIALDCYAERCAAATRSAQDILCEDHPTLGFAPLRVVDLNRF